MSKLYYLVLPLFLLLIFFPVLAGKLPIPTDDLVGLYHPWRDFLSQSYPSGVPFKNFLLTDPIRQQYVWRKLAWENIQTKHLASWNPFEMAGVSLSGNPQSAAFYPLNFAYLFATFPWAWTVQIIFQPILGFIFMYLFLRTLKLTEAAALFGSLTFIGSGFFISWLEHNTLVQTALWLPLIFYALEKKRLLPLTIALICSLLAGALQIFIYIFLFSFFYALHKKTVKLFLFSSFLTLLICVFPLFQMWSYFQNSLRSIDALDYLKPGWFLPPQNLVQFLAPDFFGNPATLNYTGVWNYMEFVGYIGVVPLIFVLLARSKFFIGAIVFCLLLMLASPFSLLPFQFSVPFFSSVQPSRLLVLVDFSLAVLAALGLNAYAARPKKVVGPVLFLFGIYLLLFFFSWHWSWQVSLKNLIWPGAIFATASVVLLAQIKIKTKNSLIILSILLLTFIDLARFANKFLPFSSPGWLYPQTKIISFLSSQPGVFRSAALTDAILPANTGTIYHLQFLSGYDSVFPARYGQFVTAIERNQPDIKSPLGFNRILIPKNYSQKLWPLFGARYLLSFDNLKGSSLREVLSEGKTHLYQDSSALPRAFFVQQIIPAQSSEEALQKMFASTFNPGSQAVVEGYSGPKSFAARDSILITNYQDNEIQLSTTATESGYLVLTDNFSLNWKAFLDDRPTTIYLTDYVFRGLVIPSGQHKIHFVYE